MNIVKHIPNTITSMNLLSGVLGVIFAFQGRFDISFYLMLAAGLFDFCDGLSARALKAYSDIGKELDSLADLISFGLLPAIMLNRFMVSSMGTDAEGWMSFICYIPLIVVVFSALRLAKFNVDERQTESFIGLATPANAIICGSLVSFVSHEITTSAMNGTASVSFLSTWAQSCWFLPILSIVLSLLLISEIPMFSMKIKKGTKTDSCVRNMRIAFFTVLLLCCILVPVFSLHWTLIPLVTFLSYVLINVINALIPKKK